MPPSPRPWFRLYSDILDNLKVKQLKPATRWQWVELMALANLSRPRGSLPPFDIIAFRLRIKEPAARTLVAEVVARRFAYTDGQRYYMHDWDEWQKDRDVAPSKRADNVTLTPVDNHANVTLSSDINHARGEESRGEEEREKEPEEEPEKKARFVVPLLPPVDEKNIFRETERMFSRPLTAVECDALRLIEAEVPERTWRYAIKEAGELNKRSLRYMQSVCTRVGDGDPDAERSPGADNGSQRGPREKALVGLTAHESAIIDQLGANRPREFYVD